ncbi:MAG TPA: TetR/AcrR family transcriptional regulator [Bryobacteraceae bacterium]
MKTGDRIIEAAATLLDSGGEAAVTLRAVAHASGVSHNAPYKHFEDRNALLAAVATRDFAMLTKTFERLRQERVKPLTKLKKALRAFSEYGRDYPQRYQLLFSDPDIAKQEGELPKAAMASFSAFSELVGECQAAKLLPRVPTVELAGLLYASVHGLIDLQASGRMKTEKGFKAVSEGITLLLHVLSVGSASTFGR